jgi:hypothetical protein
VSRLGRYWRLWRTLPDAERRMRARRVLDRTLRRDPRVRRLGLLPDSPSWSSFRRALSVSDRDLPGALRAATPIRGPLFAPLKPRAEAVVEAHPDHATAILAHAEQLLESRFDLLGSGDSRPVRDDGNLDWHVDWSTGQRWPEHVYYSDVETVRGDGSDVKLPWELSRCQHFLVLGQAWWLAPIRMQPDAATALRQRCAKHLRTQIDNWILRNPRGLGVNWTCPMDVAIRAINWLAGVALMRDAPELDDSFLRRLCRSLWVHGQHIRSHLEIGGDGLTSNHYLTNVAGLYALGCGLPELRDAAEWRGFGRRALIEEMPRQVGADGVDFERSIPYHRLVTEIFLHAALLGRVAGEPFPPDFMQRLSLMLEFVATYTRPDGSAPQWGDNDDGRLLPLQGYAAHDPHDHRHLLAVGGSLLDRPDLLGAAAGHDVEAHWLLDAPKKRVPTPRSGTPSRAFADAGYYVMRGDGLHCGISCGPVGTAGLGNHTHNDLLALCVWSDGVEWITDPGSGNYTGDPELRNRLRSTAAHATLQLGEREQNAFGTGLDELFRLEERAHPEVERWQVSGAIAELVARHRGFGATGERWIHRRHVRFEPARRRFSVEDHLNGESASTGGPRLDEPVFLRFPLRPGTICTTLAEPGVWPAELVASVETARERDPRRPLRVLELSCLGDPRLWILLELPPGSEVEVREGLYSPRYGVAEPAPVVTAIMQPAATLVARTTLQAGGAILTSQSAPSPGGSTV